MGRRESPARQSQPTRPQDNNSEREKEREKEREVRVTPFKRSRSRVYYASQRDSLAAEGGKEKPGRRDLSFSPPCVPTSVQTHDAKTTPTSKATLGSSAVNCPRNTSPVSSSSFDNLPSFKFASNSKLSPTYKNSHKSCKELRNEVTEEAILEAGEEVCSSGEEAGESEVSPGGSFRGSLRGSPSHRSQDSGYSDSGESNAHNDSDGSPTTPPNVKHITRVYFRDSPEEACLYNDKIVCTPEQKGLAESSRTGSEAGTLSEDPVSNTQTNPINSTQSSPSSDCSGNLEELSEELEHKSLLETDTRNTGAIRKRYTNTCTPTSRRPQRRITSTTDKSATTTHNNNNNKSDSQRRPTPLKARRRWSTADVQNQQHSQGHSAGQSGTNISSHTSRSTSTFDLAPTGTPSLVPDGGGRLTGTTSLDALDDPVPAWRVANDTTLARPRPLTARRIRIHPTAIAKEMRNGSVSQWVRELRVLYEAECMNTLQSKSLPGDPARRHTSVPPSARHAVRAIQRRAHAVSTEFARLCQRLEWLDLGEVPPLAESLVEHINTFLKDYTTQWTAAHPDLQPQSSLSRQSKVIRQICERLREVCQSKKEEEEEERKEKEENNESQHKTRQVVQVVTALGHAFTKLVDLMLSREIRVVVRVLEETREEEVKAAVSHLTALGVDGGHICRLIARLGGVRGLLGVCLEPRLRQVRVAALRALATVSCVVEGIVELEKAGGVEVVAEAGGVEVVAEVLCDEQCCEEERSEAAGVLAQITSPWVENTHRLPALTAHMSPIVQALTALARSTRSAEIFLLASAALANLTFLDGGSVEAMRTAGTSRVLLKAARDSPNISIFTKDQIATVLANLAGSQEAAEEVVEEDGVSVLLSLLNTRPAPTHRLPEVATAERVQQKSAIALSRLCRDSSVARQVAKLGGAERLVRLCKDEHERNHSDAVLVACLAALRKMASSLGSEELRGMDATELVEPRLLDSFLIYSSRQESYV
ncbi:hypothetical protein Pcinc_029765 [Petrolisthes cinctipes]|uniref:Protein inscuteable homologue C-terminal domain-containing protein n=1 Tax=Petrolisthes cinctipes TaxID=88211 RepID=A0AAE1K6Z7_PETCI|nr:hypothetical protein Pcinc_029765 [Petrolisthes cinctipes]